jgi:hypothetical protein
MKRNRIIFGILAAVLLAVEPGLVRLKSGASLVS